MTRLLIPALLLTLVLPLSAQNATDAKPLVEEVIAAAGGRDKLLTLFRIQEIFHFGDTPEPAEGKKRSTRSSVIEPPKYWWLGKKERADEPAKFDVWAWTLGIFTAPESKVEVIPDLTDEGKTCFGLKVSGSVTPAMDFYFDKETKLLHRLDWRGDIYRFSDWKEHDGAKYASRTIIYKKAGGKPWFFHEVTGVERLKELPEGLVR
ncbi:MAG: hypothetical protein V4662_24385 [Verrucomicrobiota bacterium]